MKLKRKLPFLLLFSLILGATLRLWHLGSYPAGFTWDETALGYNAYSILKTARDEHGAFLPITFKSFGDYKPGLYIYLAVPSVAIFGLSHFATRLPSALFGIAGIYVIYLLGNLLFKKSFKPLRGKVTVGEISAFILAVSPWHVHFSRGAWETNVFSVLLLFSIYSYLKSLKDDRYLLAWVIPSILTLVTYQAAKMLTPLIFLSLFALTWKDFWPKLLSWFKKSTTRTLLILAVLAVIAIFLQNILGPAGNRLTRLSVFNYRPPVSEEIKQIDSNNPLTLKLFHGQTQLTTKMITSRYLNHFSPEVLFYQDAIVSPREHIPRLGMLHYFEAGLLLLGIFAFFKIKNKRSRNILIVLLLLAPLPASLTLAEYSTIRALFLIIPFSLLLSLGLSWLLSQKFFYWLPLLSLYLFNIFFSFDVYFNHSNHIFAREFQYGHQSIMEQIQTLPSQKTIITDVFGQPYIFYLFYTQFDPAEYQQMDAYIDQGIDVGRVYQIGQVEFRQFNDNDVMLEPDTWFIGSRGNISDEFDYNVDQVEYSSEIKVSNPEEVIFRIVKTKAND